MSDDYLDEPEFTSSGEFHAPPVRDPRDIATPPRWDQIPTSGRLAWTEGGLPLFQPAAPMRRVVSWLIDATLIVTAVAAAAAVDTRVWEWLAASPTRAVGSLLVAAATLRAVLFAVRGVTPGLRVCGLRVVTHGYPGRVAAKSAFWRWFVALLYAAWPVGLVAAAVSVGMMFRRGDGVTLHDWVAGTVICERWDRDDVPLV